jgi:hypothetical protein
MCCTVLTTGAVTATSLFRTIDGANFVPELVKADK